MEKTKQKLPKWFKGELYKEGAIVRNRFSRQEYELNYDELDEIIKNNPDDDMVDIGGNHFIATHNVKDSLY